MKERKWEQDNAVGVRGFRGKCLCIVFYPKKEKFTLGVKAFAASQELFNKDLKDRGSASIGHNGRSV